MEVCQRKAADPWRDVSCGWRDYSDGEFTASPGRYMYEVRWPDGTVQRGAKVLERDARVGGRRPVHADEMQQVAAGAPPLSKVGLERYTRGRRQVGKAQPIKLTEVATELTALDGTRCWATAELAPPLLGGTAR